MALILTGSGSDTINGTTNTDLIYSGSGNDIVNAGDGSDIVYLGYGNDIVIHDVVQNLNDYDLYIGGASTDTLRLLVTTAEMNAINSTNLVSSFMASATTWLQIFNFSSYNSLLGFNLNIVTQGFENIEFVITDVVNNLPTAVDAMVNTNEDAGTVSINLVSTMNASSPDGIAVQSVVFASGDALSFSVVGDTLQFDANQFNSLLASQSKTPVLNVTFVDGDGDIITKALTLHVQGVNDAPTANVDSFGTLNDTTDANVIQLGNVLSNDTDPDVGDTKSVVSATISFSGYVSGASVTGAPVDLVQQVDNVVSDPNIVHSIIFGGITLGAILSVYKDGHIELTKNSALNYLPDGQSLTVNISYTMEDSNHAQSSAMASFTFLGADNNDFILGTNGSDNIVLGIGNDTVYLGDGNDTVSGGSGVKEIDAGSGDDLVNASTWTQSNVLLGSGADTFIGSNGVDTVDAREGDDTINGGAGKDTLFGGAGNDTLFGGAGDDTLVGGAGKDTIDGGNGIDTISYGDITYGVYVDMMNGIQYDNITFVNEDLFTSIEIVEGSNFNDTIVGSFGDDVIKGGVGDDQLVGNAGNDILVGGQNTGPSGVGDTLLGNAGADTFVFDVLADGIFKTTVNDFQTSQNDKLDFKGVSDLASLDVAFGSGVVVFDHFSGAPTTTFTSTNGAQLIFVGVSINHLSDLSANIIFG